MRKRSSFGLALAVVIMAIALVQGLGRAQGKKQPVYVGSRVCGSCHQGPGMGHQYSRWLLSKHARAYAALAKPEAEKIAELSGVIQEPRRSRMCLGCHATGSEAEEWEKDDTFHIEDGVQCEKCHGPGSEYMDAEIMKDPDSAARAGLQMPKETLCRVCHVEKGSHVAVLASPLLDIQKGLEEIAHPSPSQWKMSEPPPASPPATPGASQPQYVGALACAPCHDAPETGYQYSKWRTSRHARAYAMLSTPEAYQLAKEQGVEGNPQENGQCLRCHSTAGGSRQGGVLEGFAREEGVGCEACHGAGSEYLAEAVMRDPRATRRAGLRAVTESTCLECHDEQKCRLQGEFRYEEALDAIAHPSKPAVTRVSEAQYKTPLNLAMTPDGRELYVACEASGSVVIVDVDQRRKVAEIPTGRQATDVAFNPDGSRAYVTNRFDDTVSVIDVAKREVIRTITVGDDPHGILTDREGSRLYVLNTSEDSISILDAGSFEELKRLAASRRPWSLSLSPDGQWLFVTNTLSRFVPFRSPSMSEVTVIDTARGVIADRVVVPGGNLLQGVAWHPSGEFALVTANRTKNLVPMTRLLQGWTITNGLAVIWREGRVDQILLDEPNLCFPDPADVAFTPDGRLALVTSSGSDRVAVVDVPKLIRMIRQASDEERAHILPNHLGKPTEYVLAHVPTGKSPRGVSIAPDGKTAFVANALDDTVSVIDVERLEAVDQIDLGGSKEITKVRWGEQLFHSANITFHRQFSCHTCHPDGHIDSITYDIEPDGLGVSPVDNRTLRGVLDTAPFKWEGTNPTLQRQCGPRLAVFFTRKQPFTPEELSALTTYIATIPRPINRYRPLGARLTEAQRRGKAIFERDRTNDGRLVPEGRRCIHCHPPPLYTNHTRQDVGTRMRFDRTSEFDVPHLNNIYDSAPYLHNGIAETLEEIWTRFNPEDKHGVTNDLTKDQLNDLIEFLKTL